MTDAKIDQSPLNASALGACDRAALLEFDRNRQKLLASVRVILENPRLKRAASDEVAGTVNALRGLVGIAG